MSPPSPSPSPVSPAGLTRLDLIWREGQVEHWLRFGRAAEEVILDRHRRRLGFVPDALFARVRWAANDVGTVLSRLDIVRCVAAGEPYATAPGVTPGGDLLLRVSGWPTVRRALALIDAVEALGVPPAEAAPDYWRHVHHRLAGRTAPEPYTLARHQAFCLRRGLAR
jgi:hypothetical protein